MIFRSCLSTSVLAYLAITPLVNAEDFSYFNQGDDWGSSYPTCGNGTMQSPVDLTETNSLQSEFLKIEGWDYPNSDNFPLNIHNLTPLPTPTKAILNTQFDYNNFSSFTPSSLRFHSPAEHTIEGKVFDLEMQILHIDP